MMTYKLSDYNFIKSVMQVEKHQNCPMGELSEN